MGTKRKHACRLVYSCGYEGSPSKRRGAITEPDHTATSAMLQLLPPVAVTARGRRGGTVLGQGIRGYG